MRRVLACAVVDERSKRQTIVDGTDLYLNFIKYRMYALLPMKKIFMIALYRETQLPKRRSTYRVQNTVR